MDSYFCLADVTKMGFLVDIMTQGLFAGALGLLLLSIPIVRSEKNLDEDREQPR